MEGGRLSFDTPYGKIIKLARWLFTDDEKALVAALLEVFLLAFHGFRFNHFEHGFLTALVVALLNQSLRFNLNPFLWLPWISRVIGEIESKILTALESYITQQSRRLRLRWAYGSDPS